MQNDQTTVYKHNFTIKWTPIDLLNGWVSFNDIAGGTVGHEPAWTVTPDGWLCLRGMLSATGATNEVFGVLPPYATPQFRHEFEWHGFNTATGYNSPAGTVQENGRMFIQVIANQSWVTLENVRLWVGA